MAISIKTIPETLPIDLLEGPLELARADAIITGLPSTLEWRGSLNQALLRAAGARLDEFVLENVYQPKVGEVFMLPGFDLVASRIIMVIVPNWSGDGLFLNDRDLLNAYRKAMEMAGRHQLTSLAFGALGTGAKAWPLRRAARLALRAIRERWYDQLGRVDIVCNRAEVIDAFASEMDFEQGY